MARSSFSSASSSPARTSGAGSSIASIVVDHVAAGVGQRHHLAPPIGRIGCSHHQPAVFEVVDRDRGRGRVHGRRRATCFTVIGPLASRRRTRIRLNGRPLRSTTARFQLSRLSITSAAIARQTSSATGLSRHGRPPCCTAMPCDQRREPLGGSRSPAATSRRRRGRGSRGRARCTRTTAAAPRSRSPRRCAASAAPATEPHSATPILTPICLLVDVTADAAPARSSGMPLTAALVIGAFTIEKPMPNTAKTISSSHTGVVAGQEGEHHRRAR